MASPHPAFPTSPAYGHPFPPQPPAPRPSHFASQTAPTVYAQPQAGGFSFSACPSSPGLEPSPLTLSTMQTHQFAAKLAAEFSTLESLYDQAVFVFRNEESLEYVCRFHACDLMFCFFQTSGPRVLSARSAQRAVVLYQAARSGQGTAETPDNLASAVSTTWLPVSALNVEALDVALRIENLRAQTEWPREAGLAGAQGHRKPSQAGWWLDPEYAHEMAVRVRSGSG